MESIFKVIDIFIQHIKDFASKSETIYHINPWIFIILFFGSALPLYYGYYRIGKSAFTFKSGRPKRKKLDTNELKIGVVIASISWCIPYLYVIIFGKLTLNMWLVFIALLIVLSAIFFKTLYTRVKKAKIEIVGGKEEIEKDIKSNLE